MIEFDTQIIPTARAMSFFFGRVQLSKCAKNFTLPGPEAAVDQVFGRIGYLALVRAVLYTLA